MPRTMKPCRKNKAISFRKLTKPLRKILAEITPLLSRGNRKLQMTFEDQLNALIYFHLEDHDSGRDLIQASERGLFCAGVYRP